MTGTVVSGAALIGAGARNAGAFLTVGGPAQAASARVTAMMMINFRSMEPDATLMISRIYVCNANVS